MNLLRALSLSIAAAACIASAQAQGVRPEIGKPLQQAAALLKSGKAREALARVRAADDVSGKTATEQLVIDRMMAAAAQRAGDSRAAIAALESIAGKVSGAELGQVAEQLAGTYAQQRNNAKAGEWLAKAVAAGNNSAGVKQLQGYLRSVSGDYDAIARDSAAVIAAAEQAGRRPDEGELLRLADAQQRLNQPGYTGTLEKLLLYYPKKDYWTAYLGRLPRKQGFADRFALDVLRLRLATGTLTKSDEFMEMAQLALQEGLPAEGLRIVEQGFKSGTLGSGDQAERHQRLKDLAIKQATQQRAAIAGQASEAANQKDGNELVRVGYAYVTLGEADRGVGMIEQGIARGGLKRPEDAKLRLGMAQLQSAKHKSKAKQTLRSVRSNDGAADIARLWTVAGTGG